MKDELPPAPDAEADGIPSLTLVLPPDLAKDEMVAGLLQAIRQSLETQVLQAGRFREMAQQCAARGGREFRLGLLRGQARGASEAAAAIVENIVEVLGLWPQYRAQILPTPAAARPHRPGRRSYAQGAHLRPDPAGPSAVRLQLIYRPGAPAPAAAQMEGRAAGDHS